MRRPRFQRLALFVEPVIALIDACDPTARSADMVQNRLGDLDPHAQALQASCHRAPDIVCDPPGFLVLGRPVEPDEYNQKPMSSPEVDAGTRSAACPAIKVSRSIEP